MLRRSLFVSTLLLAGTFGFASSAKAQSAPVPFQANVPAECTLDNPQQGTLAVRDDGQLLSSASSIGGIAGSIDIECNSDATLSVSLPVEDTNNPTTGTTLFSVAGTNNGSADSNGGTFQLSANSKETVRLDMQAQNASFKAGAYNYTVTVTATP